MRNITWSLQPQEKEDWINAIGRAIVKHSRRWGPLPAVWFAGIAGCYTNTCSLVWCAGMHARHVPLLTWEHSFTSGG